MILALQVAAFLTLAAVAIHQRTLLHRARQAPAHIEAYARNAATKARPSGAVYAYRDVAKVARGGKGRWS